MAQTYNNLGLVYKAKGEWDKAIEFYNKDLKISEQVGDVHGMAQTYGNISLLKFQQKDYEPAIHLHVEILLLFVKMGAQPLVQQAAGILQNFAAQMPTDEYGRISQTILQNISRNGIQWGRHQIMAPAEAQQALAQLQPEKE